METLEQPPDANDRSIVVGVDVGGSKIALMVTDVKTGEELARDRMPTPADIGPAAMIDALREAVLKLIDGTGRPADSLCSLGIAVPGLVDFRNGRVIRAGNLQGWIDIPLRAILHHELGIPIWLDQDANAAALGECWRGCAGAMESFVFLARGTGVGAGVFINGQLHRGRHNAAGEVGNFLMGRKYLGRERGGHGNLERLIGSPTIKEQAQREAGKDVAADEAISAASEDLRLEAIANRVADYLTIAIVNIAALLDPDAIIVGGGTAAAGHDLLVPVRERVARELARPPAIMHSVLGEDAQLCGATYGALRALDDDGKEDKRT